MSANANATAPNASPDAWHAHPVDKTSQTDDERIKDITVLPPPEHLIRFFPIAGSPVEALITGTRRAKRATACRSASAPATPTTSASPTSPRCRRRST